MSATKQRQVICYPAPLYHKLFKALVKVRNVSESEAGSDAIKNMIDNLPRHQKKQVMEQYEKMFSKNSY